MKIKVGEYVRSHLGGIGKVTRIENNSTTQFLYEDETLITIDRNVIKHSSKIIDLIEVGDYVNGCRVVNFVFNDEKKVGVAVDSEVWAFDTWEIKTIVTHELFKDNEYKVEEK